MINQEQNEKVAANKQTFDELIAVSLILTKTATSSVLQPYELYIYFVYWGVNSGYPHLIANNSQNIIFEGVGKS
jgi:hypothetical protein